MSDSLFLLGGDGGLRTMSAAAFITEDEFQELLGKFPSLLTDAAFGESEPRRWVLVRREMAVADQEGGSGRWSLDHLFLDQDGVPTLVEVKRASDTRGRREVVAQMLDYAANAVSWWQLKDLQDAFALTCQKLQQTPGETLVKLLDQPEPDEEAYWKAVQSNLRSGRIRMLFVADVIYPELQRIIEFLNDQMNPAVVAGLELRAYQSGADKLIVPRLLGQTQKAQAAKSVSGVAFSGSPEGWLAAARQKWTSQRVAGVDRLIQVCLQRELTQELSKGGSLVLAIPLATKTRSAFWVLPSGVAQLNLGFMTKTGGLADKANRIEALQRFNAVPGLSLTTQNPEGFPTFAPEKVEVAGGWPSFSDAVAWFSDTARATPEPSTLSDISL